MTQESRLSIVIDNTVAQRQAQQFNQALIDMTTAGTNVGTTMDGTGQKVDKVGKVFEVTGQKVDKGSQSVVAHNRALLDAGQQALKTGDQVDKLGKSHDNLSKSTQDVTKHTQEQVSAMGSAKESMKMLVEATIGLIGIHEALGAMDTYTNITNKLHQVTQNQVQLNYATEATYQIAMKSRVSWEAATDIYMKFGKQADMLGLSQKGVASITEVVTKAVTLSHVSVATAERGIYQFGQALNQGYLHGQDFNSVMEEIPFLGQAVAKGLGVSQAQLKAMAEAGQLTTEKMVSALQKAAPEINKLFESTTPTIQQGFQAIENATTKFIGENTTGAARGLGEALGGIANNIDLIGTAIEVAGIAKIGSMIGSYTQKTYESIAAQLRSAEAARVQAAAEVALAQTELREATANAEATRIRYAAYTSHVEVTAAIDAQIAAQARLKAANEALNVSTGVVKGALSSMLGILGGPVGIAVTLAGVAAAWYETNSAESAAKAATDDLGQSIADLTKKYQALNAEQLKQKQIGAEQGKKDARSDIDSAVSSIVGYTSMTQFTNMDAKTRAAQQYANDLRSNDPRVSGGALQKLEATKLFDKDSVAELSKYGEELLTAKKNLQDYANVAISASQAQKQQLEALSMTAAQVQAKKFTEYLSATSQEAVKNISENTLKASLMNSGVSPDVADEMSKHLMAEKEKGLDITKLTAQQYKQIADLAIKTANAQQEQNNAQEQAADLQSKMIAVSKSYNDTASSSQIAAIRLKYDRVNQYDNYFQSASDKTNVPASILKSVMFMESGGDANIRDSRTGAQGIMQMEPATAKRWQVDVRNVKSSIDGAAKYLQWLYERYGDWDKALAGYNAGEGNVDKYKGVPKFKETMSYVRRSKPLSAMFGADDGEDIDKSAALKAQAEVAKKQKEFIVKYDSATEAERKKHEEALTQIELLAEDKRFVIRAKEVLRHEQALSKIREDQHKAELNSYDAKFNREMDSLKEQSAAMQSLDTLQNAIDQARIGHFKEFEPLDREKLLNQEALNMRMKEYYDLIESNKTPEQKALESADLLYSHLKILHDTGGLTNEQYNIAKSRADSSYSLKQRQAYVANATDRINTGQNQEGDAAISMLGELTKGFTDVNQAAMEMSNKFASSMQDGIVGSLTSAIMHTKKFGDAMRDVARGAVQELISSMIKMGIQYTINAAMGESISAASSAASVAEAAMVAAAWSPAATMVSLASFGANAIPAATGIASVGAVTSAISLAGYYDGGYTGDGGKYEYAGSVHKGEVVWSQEDIKRAGGVAKVEAMRQSGMGDIYNVQNGSSGGDVHVHNYTGANVSTNRDSSGNMHITIKDIEQMIDSRSPRAVAQDLNNPNSHSCKAIKRNFLVQHNRS